MGPKFDTQNSKSNGGAVCKEQRERTSLPQRLSLGISMKGRVIFRVISQEKYIKSKSRVHLVNLKNHPHWWALFDKTIISVLWKLTLETFLENWIISDKKSGTLGVLVQDKPSSIHVELLQGTEITVHGISQKEAIPCTPVSTRLVTWLQHQRLWRERSECCSSEPN